jgi:uncharacterized protein (TIGR00369 family)
MLALPRPTEGADVSRPKFRGDGQAMLALLRASLAMDGLTYVREMRDQGLNYPPIGEFVHFAIRDVAQGRIEVTGRPEARHYNPFGVVHGGFACTLMDLALGHVSVTMLPSMENAVVTTDLSVKYLRPLYASVGEVACVATVLHGGKTIIVAEAQLRDQTGKLYATAQSTCFIVPRQRDTRPAGL